jgi:hypothetical protein
VGVAESLNQPYPLKWERGEFGDLDAYTRLPDGTQLGIMFSKDHGGKWFVDFHRGHSLSVTGQGDSIRIFATVMFAIQQFVKRIKPRILSLMIHPEEKQAGVKTPDRISLYDALAKRYAPGMGYTVTKREAPQASIWDFVKIESAAKPLDEVFNTKPGKKNSYWEHEGEDGSVLHFETSNGFEYKLDIMAMWLGADEAKPWEFADITDEQDDTGRYVEFLQKESNNWMGGKRNVTGTGSSAEVFSIVTNGILQYVKKFKPPFLMFQAAEINRRRLYDAIIRRLLPMMPNYKVIGPRSDGVYFVYDSRVIKPYTTQVKEGASGYIPSNAECDDPRFKTALTVDIKPDSIKRNAKKLGLGNIHRSGIPQTARSDGKFK